MNVKIQEIKSKEINDIENLKVAVDTQDQSIVTTTQNLTSFITEIKDKVTEWIALTDSDDAANALNKADAFKEAQSNVEGINDQVDSPQKQAKLVEAQRVLAAAKVENDNTQQIRDTVFKTETFVVFYQYKTDLLEKLKKFAEKVKENILHFNRAKQNVLELTSDKHRHQIEKDSNMVKLQSLEANNPLMLKIKAVWINYEAIVDKAINVAAEAVKKRQEIWDSNQKCVDQINNLLSVLEPLLAEIETLRQNTNASIRDYEIHREKVDDKIVKHNAQQCIGKSYTDTENSNTRNADTLDLELNDLKKQIIDAQSAITAAVDAELSAIAARQIVEKNKQDADLMELEITKTAAKVKEKELLIKVLQDKNDINTDPNVALQIETLQTAVDVETQNEMSHIIDTNLTVLKNDAQHKMSNIIDLVLEHEIQSLEHSIASTTKSIEQLTASARAAENEYTNTTHEFTTAIHDNVTDDDRHSLEIREFEKWALFYKIKGRLQVVRGNLLTIPAQVIVNPSNLELKHMGGLDNIIKKAAGSAVQTELDIYKTTNPQFFEPKPNSRNPNRVVFTGCVVFTESGNLKNTNGQIKKIAHVVGPDLRIDIKNSREPTVQDANDLTKIVDCTLQKMIDFGFESINIPAISGGIFGYPTEKLALVLYNACVNFLQRNSTATLQINLVLNSSDHYNIFQKAALTILKQFADKKNEALSQETTTQLQQLQQLQQTQLQQTQLKQQHSDISTRLRTQISVLFTKQEEAIEEVKKILPKSKSVVMSRTNTNDSDSNSDATQAAVVQAQPPPHSSAPNDSDSDSDSDSDVLAVNREQEQKALDQTNLDLDVLQTKTKHTISLANTMVTQMQKNNTNWVSPIILKNVKIASENIKSLVKTFCKLANSNELFSQSECTAAKLRCSQAKSKFYLKTGTDRGNDTEYKENASWNIAKANVYRNVNSVIHEVNTTIMPVVEKAVDTALECVIVAAYLSTAHINACQLNPLYISSDADKTDIETLNKVLDDVKACLYLSNDLFKTTVEQLNTNYEILQYEILQADEAISTVNNKIDFNSGEILTQISELDDEIEKRTATIRNNDIQTYDRLLESTLPGSSNLDVKNITSKILNVQTQITHAGTHNKEAVLLTSTIGLAHENFKIQEDEDEDEDNDEDEDEAKGENTGKSNVQLLF